MHYVVWGGEAPWSRAPLPGVELLANGEMIVLEGPWPMGATALACVQDEATLAALKGLACDGVNAFAVEGLEHPGCGSAYVIAAHKMLDPEGFRPYAQTIPGLLAEFGVRSLARGGRIIPIAGDFVPDRGVVLEFESPQAVIDFYTDEVYAPLLALRLRTTDPRFAVLSRTGHIPPATAAAAHAYLAAHPR